VQETLGLLRIHAQEKGVRLEAYLDGLVPRLIKGDPTRLRQILVNFVGNAIKFTPAGKRVSLRLEGHPEPPTLRFSVSDEGIGMTPEQQARLFQPFEQGDPSPRRRSHGTGLGLSISRHLADAMGARITVESQVDHGSTFTLELTDLGRDLEWVSDPLAAQRLRPAGIHRNSLSAYPVSSNPELSGRILLVEDNPDNQRMLVYHLRSMGLEVDVAADGVAGVVQALEGKHALILMDMQMPEMDGYTATLRLRERGYDRPIIALTAHATVEDRDRCLEAGCNDYLTKPVDLRRLQASIAGLMQERAPREEVIHSTFHDDPHFREILKQYVQGLAGQVDRLRQAASAERLRLVHQMKGAAGMYGYPQFGELAAVLEAALHERREDTLINELLDEMEIMANQIFQGL
jgi:CheY-like chemotaxis protein